MPCAPASSARRAACATLGMALVRVFRSVATLLTFTLSFVIPVPSSPSQGKPAGQGERRRLDPQDARPQIDDAPACRRRLLNLVGAEPPFRPDGDGDLIPGNSPLQWLSPRMCQQTPGR